MSSHLVWTLLRMISINHTPCHYGNLVYVATRVKPLLFIPLKESRWAADVYILNESKWAKGQGGLLLFTPRQSQNMKRFNMGCSCLPLDRVNLAVNSKKETKARVKMDQGSRWVCVI